MSHIATSKLNRSQNATTYDVQIRFGRNKQSDRVSRGTIDESKPTSDVGERKKDMNDRAVSKYNLDEMDEGLLYANEVPERLDVSHLGIFFHVQVNLLVVLYLFAWLKA